MKVSIYFFEISYDFNILLSHSHGFLYLKGIGTCLLPQLPKPQHQAQTPPPAILDTHPT